MTPLARLANVIALGCCCLLPARAQDLQNLYRLSGDAFATHVEYHVVKVPRGTEVTLADLKGPGKVTYWYITDHNHGHWYPGLVLKVFWDEESAPSIVVPLSDFFGALGGATVDYRSGPMQINHLCYMCWLPMPFSTRARFVLANDGDRDYSQAMAYGIDYDAGPEYAQEKSRLHPSWSRSNPTRNSVHTILEARGHGQYVGNFLKVHTTYRGWWGEGDTIFVVDGRTITHTPGTEDEYGSCWGFGPELYSLPALGHIEQGEGNNLMYRWYMADPVRFAHSLKVQIQDQRSDKAQIPSRDDFTSVAFWYQKEPHQPIALESFAERVAPSQAAAYGQR